MNAKHYTLRKHWLILLIGSIGCRRRIVTASHLEPNGELEPDRGGERTGKRNR